MRNPGGTTTARYCYWVWVRHLCLAARHGLPAAPKVVAELGPGESLGTGIAALLTGADRYYGLDIVRYVSVQRNLAVFGELIDLLNQRAPIPEGEFGKTLILKSTEFPGHILTDDRLQSSLKAERVQSIRQAIMKPGDRHNGICLSYDPAWMGSASAPDEQPEMILSHAVLEHVDDLGAAYHAMHRWLSPGGFVSHQIDFRSHGFARDWNGHWTYSDRTWRLVRGRRRYAINREPLSAHLTLLEKAGFEIVKVIRIREPSAIRQEELALRFRSLTRDDLSTRGAFVHARKP